MLVLWRVTICSTSFKAGTCNKPTAKQSRLGSEQKEATPFLFELLGMKL